MNATITLPVWIFIILLSAFILVVIRVVIFPLWASFWNVRSRHIVDEINPLLQLNLSPFTLTRRRVLADRLASDEIVEEGVKEIAQQRGVPVDKLQRETWRIAWDIVPGFNPYFYFRIGYRLARSTLRSLYRVRINFADEGSMARVSDQAAVVFIINHRSNIDYVVANFLTAKRTMLSFGVGEWSRMWPIQPLMRMAGGYFVRRDSGDPLYRLLIKRYVQLATTARVPHAIFLEGQLSPDGRVGEPRLGLLSYVTERFNPDTSADLVFIPVAINYDRIAEDKNMIRYSSHEFRKMGRSYVARKAIGFGIHLIQELILRRRVYGYACAAFGEPISFGEWTRQRDIDWPGLSRIQRFEQIEFLGSELIGNISNLMPATPVPLLCRIWINDPQLVLSEEAMRCRFQALHAILEQSNCHVVLVKDSIDDTFDHALTLVTSRKMILRNADGNYKANQNLVALLYYYANSLSQFYEDSL